MSIKDRLSSVWEEDRLPEFPPLNQDRKCEVCIVGGGMAGISTAYQLAKRGHEVLLLEAFRLGSGQTGRTTAHLSNQLEEQFHQLLKMHDAETVELAAKAHRTAVDTIEEVIKEEGIECDFRRVDGHLYMGENFSVPDLMKEQEAARECGVELQWCEKTPWPREGVPSLRFSGQGKFSPLKYLEGLLMAMEDKKVAVHEGTHVVSIKNVDSDHTVLRTDSGHEIEARFVVVATDSPVNTRLAIHNKQFAYRTYAMAFGMSAPPEEDVLLWDTEDPYHYIRTVGDLLVVGGEDHRTGQDPYGDPFEALERWARANFSFINEVRLKWSGQVFEPADQLQFIGKAPGPENNIFIVTGASGIGMTTGTIASIMLPDLIEGREHPWEDIFSPRRKPLGHLSDYVKENVNVALQYRDWFTGSEVDSIEDIPVDEGAVIREGLSKSSVYHESEGHYETKTAACTHLGGIVRWNDIEKTWDCPCHGSRFNTQGQVIEGPAISGLEES